MMMCPQCVSALRPCCSCLGLVCNCTAQGSYRSLKPGKVKVMPYLHWRDGQAVTKPYRAEPVVEGEE